LISLVDDEYSLFTCASWGDAASPPDAVRWRVCARAVPGEVLDPEAWETYGTMANRFRQSRARMKEGNFTGIRGIPNQDIAMWVSMGARVDRSKDILGASDLAIVEFRRLMVDAAVLASEGGPIIGTDPDIVQTQIASFEGVVSKELDWRDLVRDAAQQMAAE